MHKDYANIGELHFKVMEEVGELLQAYGKVGRFGPMGKHPNHPDGLTNAEQVIMECEDVVTRVRELKQEMYNVMQAENGNTEDDDEDPEVMGLIDVLDATTELMDGDLIELDDPYKTRPFTKSQSVPLKESD